MWTSSKCQTSQTFNYAKGSSTLNTQITVFFQESVVCQKYLERNVFSGWRSTEFVWGEYLAYCGAKPAQEKLFNSVS